jgi:peptide/nickel transport system substrate-binding protein
MRPRPLSNVAFPVILAIVLAACGTSASPTPGSSAGPESSAGSGEIPEHILNYAYASSWDTLQPVDAWNHEPDILAQIYETLTNYDTANNKITPGLATSWEHNSDATQWTFHLRPNVTFHDGTKLTADAVKSSLERAAKGKGPAYLYANYKDIVAVDDLTVQISLTRPQPLDWMLSAGWGAYIMSSQTVAQPDDWFQTGQGAGTGPYKWVSYDPGQSAVIERYPEYWGGWQAGQLTKIVYTFVTDLTARQQMIETGQADLASSFLVRQLVAMQSNPDLGVTSFPNLAAKEVLFNTALAPTDNKLVREALAAAFPTDQIITTVFSGEDSGFTSKNQRSFAALALGGGVSADGYTYDLEKAKQLLAQAGHPNGGITFSLAFENTSPEFQQIGELWQGELSKIGVTLKLQQVTSAAYDTIATGPDSVRPAIFTAWTPDYASPDGQMSAKFVSDSPQNQSAYHNPSFDKVLGEAVEAMATDTETGLGKFQEANQMLFDDMPAFPFVDRYDSFAYGGYISGVGPQHVGLVSMYNMRDSRP